MTGDETEIEIEIARILYLLGQELIQAAKQLRLVPYSQIEPIILRRRETLNELACLGRLMKKGQIRTALSLMEYIEIPGVDIEDTSDIEESAAESGQRMATGVEPK